MAEYTLDIDRDGPKKLDLKWWDTKTHEGHDKAWAAYEQISKQDGGRKELNLRHMRLYGNVDMFGLSPSTYDVERTKEKLSLNVIKAVSDAATAKIAKNRPSPRFLTSGGNFSLSRRAKLLGKWADTQFYLSGIYQVAPAVFLDACVFGTGVLKVFRQKDKIRVERVLPTELFVDRADALYGSPRSLYQRKYVNRDWLLNRAKNEWKVDRKTLHAIENCTSGPDQRDMVGVDSMSDQVVVVEAWHLPSGPGAQDGRHIIFIDGATLVDSEWEYEYFPFGVIRWTPRLMGFWGIGLAEELTGIQVEINKLLIKIQQSFRLMAQPVWMVDQASLNIIKKGIINNEIGQIVAYAGQKPEVYTPPTVHPEIFAHLDRLYSRAFEISGISQLQVSAQRPAGVEAGVALRTLNDIQSERFSIVSRAYEQMFLDVTKIMVDLGKEIYKSNKKYSVVLQRDRNTIDEVDWKDIDMDGDSYVLKVFPVSALPNDPAGKLAHVADMMSLGLVDPQLAKRLLDYPDLEEDIALDRAACDNADRLIEKMLDEGLYEPPEPFVDLQLTLKKVQAAYNRAVNMGVPEDRLEMLREFMLALHEHMERQRMAQAQVPGTVSPASPPPYGGAGTAPTALRAEDGSIAY